MKLSDEIVLYRKVKIGYRSGNTRSLILSQSEIMAFSTALSDIDGLKQKGINGFTLWYDMDLPEEHRKLSLFVVLDSVEFLDIGDTDYTLDQLKNVNMGQFNIWGTDKVNKAVKKTAKKKKTVKKVVKKAVKKIKKQKKENGFLKDIKNSLRRF